MNKRLKEMEDEAAALREMQAKVEQEMGAVQGSSGFPLQRRFMYFTANFDVYLLQFPDVSDLMIGHKICMYRMSRDLFCFWMHVPCLAIRSGCTLVRNTLLGCILVHTI